MARQLGFAFVAKEIWKRRRAAARFADATVCPVCRCTPFYRCVLTLPDGSEVVCVPAGVYGARVCSACARKPASI